MSVKDAWAEAGRITVTLPSGFRVRGVLPSPSEVIRLKIVPQTLRREILGFESKMMNELSEDEHAAIVDGRRYQAAAFIRAMAPPGTTGDDGWEPVTLTKDELADMPPGDVEALDDLIGGYATAEMITVRSEVVLGLREAADLVAVKQREAGDTVDGWRDFRIVDGGGSPDTPSADVEPVPVRNPRDRKPVDRVRGGRRSSTPRRRQTGPAADGPIATA